MKIAYKLVVMTAALGLSYSALLMAHGADKPSGELKMEYFKNAQRMKLKSMNIKDTNAFLQDIVSSDDAKAPISCGLFRMEKGRSLTYTYTYDEAKIILEGEMTVADGFTKVKAKAGDILYFPKGATITFSSDNYGLGFICGQRPADSA